MSLFNIWFGRFGRPLNRKGLLHPYKLLKSVSYFFNIWSVSHEDSPFSIRISVGISLLVCPVLSVMSLEKPEPSVKIKLTAFKFAFQISLLFLWPLHLGNIFIPIWLLCSVILLHNILFYCSLFIHFLVQKITKANTTHLKKSLTAHL